MSSVIMLGDGAHAEVVRNCLTKSGHSVMGTFGAEHEDELKILCDHLEARGIDYGVHIGLGDNRTRSKLAAKQNGYKYASAISGHAVIEATAEVGDGSFIGPMAYLGLNVVIGKHTIINTGTLVDHDVSVGDFSHIAGNAYIAGGVSIGDLVLIGAGATVIEGITVGSGITVGAGSVVVKSITKPGVYVGVPATKIK